MPMPDIISTTADDSHNMPEREVSTPSSETATHHCCRNLPHGCRTDILCCVSAHYINPCSPMSMQRRHVPMFTAAVGEGAAIWHITLYL